MEPKSPEGMPSSGEYTPIPPDYGGEHANETLPERRVEAPMPNTERSQERSGGTVQLQQPTPVQLPTPVPPPQDDTPKTANSASNMPATAADEDLIEKEWVDTAKKIISNTKENPYERERQVNKLQADYLKKRYGKDLGQTS